MSEPIISKKRSVVKLVEWRESQKTLTINQQDDYIINPRLVKVIHNHIELYIKALQRSLKKS